MIVTRKPSSVATGAVVQRGERLAARPWLDSAMARIVDSAATFLGLNPLRGAAPREHVRSASGLDASLFDLVVAEAVSTGRLDERGANGLAPAGYELTLTPAQETEIAAFCGALKVDGASPRAGNIPAPALLAYLVDRRVDTVVVVGGATSNCVRATVFDASSYNFRVIVPHDAVFDRLAVSHAISLFDMDRQFADVVSTDDVISQLSQSPPLPTASIGAPT